MAEPHHADQEESRAWVTARQENARYQGTTATIPTISTDIASVYYHNRKRSVRTEQILLLAQQ